MGYSTRSQTSRLACALSSSSARLPPITAFPRLNLRPAEDLEQQLQLWRSACAAAYAALRDLPPDLRKRVQHPVAKTVGQTMRILLRLGEINTAKELDRVFFSDRAGRHVGKGGRTRASDHSGGRWSAWALRDGLGLPRGEVRLAWMSSFASRLDKAVRDDDEVALQQFGELLRQMYEQRGDGQIRQDACTVAFLTRRMGIVQDKLASLSGEGGGGAHETREQVGRLLAFIKDAEAEDVEVVSFALLETALERLERSKGNPLEDPFFPKVEEDIQSLVGSLETTSEFSLHNLLLSYTSSLERHAQILHLAIRFLLLRARYSDPPPSSSSSPSPLQSAAKLYLLLLKLTRRVDTSSTDELVRLRQRQSSALYRVLAAHIAVLDDSAQVEEIAHSALDLVDASLATVAALPPIPSPSDAPTDGTLSLPDPRLLGISTRAFRRFLFAITRPHPPAPSSSTSEASQSPESFPPFSLVARTLSALVAVREHDVAFTTTPGSISTGGWWEHLPAHEQTLFEAPNFALALARSALSGSAHTSPSSSSGRDDADTPLARLDILFTSIESLERTSVSPAGLGTGERRARLHIRRAVGEVVHSEWAGEAAREWREAVGERMRRWAREGRDWDEVRGRVREVEEGKGKKKVGRKPTPAPPPPPKARSTPPSPDRKVGFFTSRSPSPARRS
ncbi:hypothetical protein JCM10207_003511 [Rhodosporidiobolus poonsookiae]